MSVNRYTTESGLQTLANGQRCWIGTKAAYEAAVQAGTMENDILVAITDDDDEYKTSTVAENDNRTITSGGVYNSCIGFPDMSNVIASIAWSKSFTYTCTQNCWCKVISDTKKGGNAVQVKLNGVTIFHTLDSDTSQLIQTSDIFPCKKGDVISKDEYGPSVAQYIIYGIR